MLDYPFLILCVLLALPAAFVVWRRPDLRGMQMRIALLSVPFAFTEWMFYPDYWEPRVLFDLVNLIGFGIEDVLFVTSLGIFSSSAWVWAAKLHLQPGDPTDFGRRTVFLLAVCFTLVFTALLAGIPMIWAAPAIMTFIAGFMCLKRPDLIGHCLKGGTLVCAVYTVICIALALIIPDVFDLNWKTEKFSNITILNIPLEEYLYAWTTGAMATIFYPFVTGATLKKITRT